MIEAKWKNIFNPGIKPAGYITGVQDRQLESELIKKSPLMMACFLLIWGGLIAVYVPRLLQVVSGAHSVIELILLVIYFIFTVVFWLLTAYFLATVTFSFMSRRLPLAANINGEDWPEVAILYTTCNDFKTEAVLSCLQQQYPHFHLFLLDDSTDEAARHRVDDFHAAHPEQTTVVRRPDRNGFKAGNLNHALKTEAAGYPFFATIDADEILPADFLTRMMSDLRNTNLAFAQANHAPNPAQKGRFARDVGPTILPFWDVHCRARNHYGFVVYVGHGAVIKRSAWEAVGGFPEMITEDLAFSICLLEKGLRGIFSEDVICLEDFPENYGAFRRQHERFIVGTTRVIWKYLRRILTANRATWIEKLDFLLWCSPLYTPAFCFVFIIVCVIGLTTFLGQWNIPELSFSGYTMQLFPVRVLDNRFAPMWTWDFQLISVIGALSPAFASLAVGLKKRTGIIRMLFLSTVPYLSLMVLSWKSLLRCFSKNNNLWPPTGDHGAALRHQIANNIPFGSKIRQRFAAAGRGLSPGLLEVCIGIILAVSSFLSFNIGFFAVSCCLIIGVYISKFGWENRISRFAASGCFILILIQMLLNLMLVNCSPGLTPFIFTVHF